MVVVGFEPSRRNFFKLVLFEVILLSVGLRCGIRHSQLSTAHIGASKFIGMRKGPCTDGSSKNLAGFSRCVATTDPKRRIEPP